MPATLLAPFDAQVPARVQGANRVDDGALGLAGIVGHRLACRPRHAAAPLVEVRAQPDGDLGAACRKLRVCIDLMQPAEDLRGELLAHDRPPTLRWAVSKSKLPSSTVPSLKLGTNSMRPSFSTSVRYPDSCKWVMPASAWSTGIPLAAARFSARWRRM